MVVQNARGVDATATRALDPEVVAFNAVEADVAAAAVFDLVEIDHSPGSSDLPVDFPPFGAGGM